MKTRTIIALIILLAAAPASAEARSRCVNEYHPSGPIFSANSLPCVPGVDMGYIDTEGNPFTEFHFLRTVSQERRDYFASHIRRNQPWRIKNPKIEDDANEP